MGSEILEPSEHNQGGPSHMQYQQCCLHVVQKQVPCKHAHVIPNLPTEMIS